MLIVLLLLIALAVYGVYDGSLEVRELVIPLVIWAAVVLVSFFVIVSIILSIVATAGLGIYFVLKIFGGDLKIR